MKIRRAFQWLIIGYAIFCSLPLILRLVLPDSHWLLWILNHYLKLFFVLMPVFWIGALVLRERKPILFLCVPTLSFFVLYGFRLIPHIRPAQDPEVRMLRVMTFNLLNRNTEYEALAETILAADADLVGLEELIPANAIPLEDLLAGEYPYHTPLPTEHILQVGLFSRYPILSVQRLNLPWRDLSWVVKVDVDGTPIKVVVVHLIPTLMGELPIREWPGRIAERQKIRLRQIDLVIDEVTDEDIPVLVLCDCNFSEISIAHRQMEGVLFDTFGEIGWGLGHTIHPVGTDFRVERIDYIWHSTDFEPQWVRVLKDGMSDHNPVVAEFTWVE
jgi:vancomycin resistance protein VanJ